MTYELSRSIYGAVVACRRKSRGRAGVVQDFEPGFCHVRSSIDKCAVAMFGMKDICKSAGVRVLPFCFSIIGTS